MGIQKPSPTNPGHRLFFGTASGCPLHYPRLFLSRSLPNIWRYISAFYLLRREVINYFLAPPLTDAHIGFTKIYNTLLQCTEMFNSSFVPASFFNVQTQIVVLPLAVDSMQLLFMSLFEYVALDFVGPLPTTFHRNRPILVFTDGFSRWVEAYPLPDKSAEYSAVCLPIWPLVMVLIVLFLHIGAFPFWMKSSPPSVEYGTFTSKQINRTFQFHSVWHASHLFSRSWNPMGWSY